jgi:hypothetical protein
VLRERPAPVEADVSQFETALVNLAANARDAMDGQGQLIIGAAPDLFRGEERLEHGRSTASSSNPAAK